MAENVGTAAWIGGPASQSGELELIRLVAQGGDAFNARLSEYLQAKADAEAATALLGVVTSVNDAEERVEQASARAAAIMERARQDAAVTISEAETAAASVRAESDAALEAADVRLAALYAAAEEASSSLAASAREASRILNEANAMISAEQDALERERVNVAVAQREADTATQIAKAQIEDYTNKIFALRAIVNGD